MKTKLKPLLYQFIARPLGEILVYVQPEKARKLSENRIILIHKNKDGMTWVERLMRFALVKKLEKMEDYDIIAEQNRNFWVNNHATELFSETEDTFNTDFIPNCTFIFDLLKKELSDQSEEFSTLVEIGTGNGDVLDYLSLEFPDFKRFVGIDLSQHQVDININRFINNSKLEFVAADAVEWVKDYGHGNTVFVSSRGVLEYFLEQRLQEFLDKINHLGKVFFIAIEPNAADHDFETRPNTQLYGDEPSFSHNYPKLFKNAGFQIWHFSQKQWFNGTNTQTFIGAKS